MRAPAPPTCFCDADVGVGVESGQHLAVEQLSSGHHDGQYVVRDDGAYAGPVGEQHLLGRVQEGEQTVKRLAGSESRRDMGARGGASTDTRCCAALVCAAGSYLHARQSTTWHASCMQLQSVSHQCPHAGAHEIAPAPHRIFGVKHGGVGPRPSPVGGHRRLRKHQRGPQQLDLIGAQISARSDVAGRGRCAAAAAIVCVGGWCGASSSGWGRLCRWGGRRPARRCVDRSREWLGARGCRDSCFGISRA